MIKKIIGVAGAGIDGVLRCNNKFVTATFEKFANESLAFAAGAFGEPMGPEIAGRIADAFRTGIGLSYEDLGPNAAHRTERMLGPWVRQALVPRIIPALNGVDEKLRNGAIVADVGCGAGVALLAMAAAFPNSKFHGYDPSSHAIGRAQAKVDKLGLQNVELHTLGGESLPADASFDFVYASHVLEHIRDDAKAISEVRRVLRPNGFAIIPVPIVGTSTVEYDEPNPHEFGHVRAPGPDYYDRYEQFFQKVDRFRSEDFDEKHQTFIYEDRSAWPTKTLPQRQPAPGLRHSDIVPVCYV